MYMKIFDIIAVLCGLKLIINGLNGEFYNLTIFNIIRWLSYLIYLIIWIFTKWKGSNNNE